MHWLTHLMILSEEVIDEGIEHYHNAAENYKKAGQVGKAVRCYEKAVSIRQALVKSIENTEKNSHLLDVANARLGYSYLMAAEAEDSERKGSMRKRLTTFSDGCLKNILIMRTSKNSGIGWEHIYSLLED